MNARMVSRVSVGGAGRSGAGLQTLEGLISGLSIKVTTASSNNSARQKTLQT